MKKRFCILILFLVVITASADAQIEYRVNAGANLQTFNAPITPFHASNPATGEKNFNELFGTDDIWKTGFFIGITSSIGLTKIITFEGDLQFNQGSTQLKSMNAILTSNNNGTLLYSNYESSFINIKVSSIDLIPELYFNLFSNFSIGAGIYLSSPIRLSEDTSNYHEDQRTYVNEVNSLDFGLTGGLKYSFKKIHINFNYLYGLTKVYSFSLYEDIDNSQVFETLRNRLSAQLGLGYTLNKI